MYKRLKEPFGKAGLIVALFALVFALVGGAYAASGGNPLASASKSKHNKKSKSKRGPRGKQGKPGKNGADGAPGAQGPAGPQGLPGANGNDGQNGNDGNDGTNGNDGKSVIVANEFPAGCPEENGVAYEIEGSSEENVVCDGETGFTETLPTGKTETGVFSGALGAAGSVSVPVSFNIPLANAPASVYVKPGEDKSASGCPKPADWVNPAIPEAAEGKICFYQGVGPGSPESASPPILAVTPVGVTPVGSVIVAACSASCAWKGVWAVTAN